MFPYKTNEHIFTNKKRIRALEHLVVILPQNNIPSNCNLILI